MPPSASIAAGGNPTINPFVNPDGEKNLYNSRQPAEDVANYLGPWSATLEKAGGYSPEAARAAALEVLPDILHYDRTRPATYPNGRILTDDVYSKRFAWLSNGKIPPSGLTPHQDLLPEFPYTGINKITYDEGSYRESLDLAEQQVKVKGWIDERRRLR